jgi:hypothetical protein
VTGLSDAEECLRRRTMVPDNNVKARIMPTYVSAADLVQPSARELLVHAWKRFADGFGRGDLVWLPIHDELGPEDMATLRSFAINQLRTTGHTNIAAELREMSYHPFSPAPWPSSDWPDPRGHMISDF